MAETARHLHESVDTTAHHSHAVCRWLDETTLVGTCLYVASRSGQLLVPVGLGHLDHRLDSERLGASGPTVES